MVMFGQSAAARARCFIANLVCMFLVVNVVVSSSSALFENSAEETVTKLFLGRSATELFLGRSNTFLVSIDDGTVQAWGKKSDVALWSFPSGPALTSFRSFSKDIEGEEEDEEYWNVEGPRVSFEDDGFISIHDVLNKTKVGVP